MEGTNTIEKPRSSETAEGFMKKVRRNTRKKFTAEEKIRIVLEGMKREIPITELCRREGVNTAVYYSWVKDFMEAGKARMKGDSLREASRDEVQKLKREIAQLKEILGDKDLELYVYKKSLDE